MKETLKNPILFRTWEIPLFSHFLLIHTLFAIANLVYTDLEQMILDLLKLKYMKNILYNPNISDCCVD